MNNLSTVSGFFRKISCDLWSVGWIYSLIFSLFLTGCGISLAGDVTPPPNLRQPIPAPSQLPADSGIFFPLVPPDPQQGAVLYQQKCLPCHGAKGMGDGPQAANLPHSVIPIGSVEVARQASPYEWYTIITQGNLQKFMPGFSSLNDRQRWDLVMYLYSLSTPPQKIEQGKTIYSEQCSACHGESGRGNGQQAIASGMRIPDWGDRSRLVRYSAKKVFDVITKGAGGMPAYESGLTEDQRWAVASYVLSLAFIAPASPAAQPSVLSTTGPGVSPQGIVGGTPTVAITPTLSQTNMIPSVTIKGKVSHVAGKSIPEDTQVTLWGFDGSQLSVISSINLEKDGTYSFKDLKLQAGWVYLTRVKVNNMQFNSDVVHTNDIKSNVIDLPIAIYDTTSETKVLSADRLHIFLDFSAPGYIQVMELYIISNPGDRVVVAENEGQPVLSFSLPPDADNLQFQDGELGGRFIRTPTGFGDLAEILPGTGQHQVLYSYEIPFNQYRLLTLETPIQVEVVTVIMPPSEARLVSDQLQDAGTRTMQGTIVQIFQASRIGAGSKINIHLYANQKGLIPGLTLSSSTLVIGGLVLGTALILAGLFLHRRQLSATKEIEEEVEGDEVEELEESSETIMDAIIALDDQYQAGILPEEAYQERRAEMKQKLRRLMDRSDH